MWIGKEKEMLPGFFPARAEEYCSREDTTSPQNVSTGVL